VCFQFRFKCKYSDVKVISDGAGREFQARGATHANEEYAIS